MRGTAARTDVDLPTRFTLVAQRRPWATCVVAGGLWFGLVAIPSGSDRWDSYFLAAMLAFVSIGSAFLAEATRGARDAIGRLAPLVVSSAAMFPVAERWGGDWFVVILVGVFVLWPQLVARFGTPRLAMTRWRRLRRVLVVFVAVMVPVEIAGELAAASRSALGHVVVIPLLLVIVPFAFRIAVESPLHRWVLFGLATAIGVVSSLAPVVFMDADPSSLALALPWIVAAPLAVLARPSRCATAVPLDHTLAVDFPVRA